MTALELTGDWNTINGGPKQTHIQLTGDCLPFADGTQKQAEQSVAIVHQLARQLRPPALDTLGLMAALNSFIKAFTQRTGIPIYVTTFGSGHTEKLNSATRIILYRVVQEALTDVARYYAQASCVEVKFEKLPDAICLEIKDNGKSFQVKRVLNPQRNKRLGLIGMRQRLERVGGSFSIQSSPGRDITVRAEIPPSPFHPRTP